MLYVARIFAGPVMFLAGLNHFLNPDFYEAIMPSYLPAHTELVYASGVAEMVGAAAIMYPPTRRAGGWWSISVLLAIFPANIHMALNASDYPTIPRWALILRLPLQAVFVFLVWRASAIRGGVSAAGSRS